MPYTLTYQSFRARAEPIRMLFYYHGIPFTDNVIPISEWSNHKSNKTIAPFSQLPSLTLPNGEVIAQTGAIIRLVAKLANNYPADPFEAAKADMLFELVMDLNDINPLLNWYEVGSEGFNSVSEKFFEKFYDALVTLDKELGNKDFFGGERPYFADFGIFNIFINVLTLRPDALKDYPRLLGFVRRVHELSAIKEYLKTRPRASECGLPKCYLQTHNVELPTINY